jgi:hypothetical protein
MSMNKSNHCVIFNANQEVKRRTSGAYRFANQMESMGWTVTVVDWACDWPEDKLLHYLDAIVGSKTLMFAFSYTWMKSFWVKAAIEKLKQRFPGRKYLAGGQQHYQEDVGFDVMMYGYSEIALPKTIDWMFNSSAASPKHKLHYSGILIDCISDYPAVSLSNYGINYRDDDFLLPHEMLTIEVSRGCKFKCKFCNFPFLGVREETHTSYDLLRAELIDNYERWGTVNYLLADETLNDRESKLDMIGDVVQSLPFEVNFSGFVRLDLTVARPSHVEKLARARVWGQYYGIETFNQEAGKSIGKSMSGERLKQGLLDMREYFMRELGVYRGTVSMIAGLPKETPQGWADAEQWLKDNWTDNNWQWYPLEISLNTSTSTSSVFAKEWPALGFRRVTDPSRVQAYQERYVSAEHRGLQHKTEDVHIGSLQWEHDHATIEQATEFCEHWQNENDELKHMKLGSFSILHHVPAFKNDIPGLLAVNNADPLHKDAWGPKGQWETIIKPYINSKMNSIQKLDELLKSNVSPGFLNQGRKLYLDKVYANRNSKNSYFDVTV